MKKLRLSFTLLNYWDSNNLEDLVKYYFHTGETTIRPGMIEGKQWDEKNTQHILDHNELLPEFGGDLLRAPVPQLKLVMDVSKEIEVVGCLDLYDTDTFWEFKTGMSMDSADYANSNQLSFYFALLNAHSLPLEKAYVVHYDPTTHQTDRTILYNKKEQLERFEQIVESKGKLIYDYFIQNGLL